MVIFIKIFSACSLGGIALLVEQYIAPVPLWIWIVPLLVVLGLLEYFLPVKEVEPSSHFKSAKKKRYHSKRR